MIPSTSFNANSDYTLDDQTDDEISLFNMEITLYAFTLFITFTCIFLLKGQNRLKRQVSHYKDLLGKSSGEQLALEGKITSLNQQLLQQKKSSESFEGDVVVFTDSISALESTLRSKDTRIQRLTSQLCDQKKLQAQLRESQEKVKILEQSVKKIKLEKKKIVENTKQLKSELTACNEKVKVVEHPSELLQSEVILLKETTKKNDQKILELQSLLEGNRKVIEQITQTVTFHKTQLIEKQSEIDSLNDQLQSCHETISRLEDEKKQEAEIAKNLLVKIVMLTTV
jgi:chromosome segregation ATPase